MIDLKDITKVYQIGEEKIYALNHVNLHIAPQEFVSVIGPSGSGKSTLMNIIGLLDTADAGVYTLDGIPINEYSENALAGVRNRKIGFVFQNFNLIAKLSAEENVELPLIYAGTPARERSEKVKKALEKVGLSSRAKHMPTELSGGQQQRVAIARAIVNDNPILLADEPTGQLDIQTKKQIIELFQRLNQNGKTIVMVTHDKEMAEGASRIVKIADGRIIES